MIDILMVLLVVLIPVSIVGIEWYFIVYRHDNKIISVRQRLIEYRHNRVRVK